MNSHFAFLFGPDDPMNFLHPNDRLAAVLTKKDKPMTIPVLDVQQRLDDDYRDQIEALNLKLLDKDDEIRGERDQNIRLRQSINGLQANMAGHTTMMNDRNAAVARCTSMESEVKVLKEELKVQIGNRDHFRALVAQQDAFIKEAKRQIEEFKRKKEEELKAKTGEAEHLARQLLKLKAENAEMATRHDQTPVLLTENRKFKEQTTRLIEEKRTLEEQLHAQKKFILELDERLTRRDAELNHEQNVGMKRWQIIEALVEAMKLFKQMPCFTWRQQGKLIRATQAKVDSLQGEVEQMRKTFYKH